MSYDLLSMSLTELEEFVLGLGEAKYRAKQIFTALHRGVPVSEMSNLSRPLREKIEAETEWRLPKVKTRLVSQIDGTVKYLFELFDGECIESVFMRYEHGNTLCISSQVGCRMGCKFCASTLAGRVRDLAPSEMLGQIIAAQLDTGERISNVVMMGIGEPLDNYANTVKFLRLVSAPEGLNIGLRHISVSTCGLVPKIDELSREELPITLSISLHAYDNETRSAIMPVNRSYPIEELLRVCKRYFEKTGRRISFEYTLIRDKNDDVAGAEKLAALLKKHVGRVCHVNLIPLNEVSETGLRTPTKENIRRFRETLEKHGINATVRRRLGSDINASCGQLRRGQMKKDTE